MELRELPEFNEAAEDPFGDDTILALIMNVEWKPSPPDFCGEHVTFETKFSGSVKPTIWIVDREAVCSLRSTGCRERLCELPAERRHSSAIASAGNAGRGLSGGILGGPFDFGSDNL